MPRHPIRAAAARWLDSPFVSHVARMRRSARGAGSSSHITQHLQPGGRELVEEESRDVRVRAQPPPCPSPRDSAWGEALGHLLAHFEAVERDARGHLQLQAERRIRKERGCVPKLSLAEETGERAEKGRRWRGRRERPPILGAASASLGISHGPFLALLALLTQARMRPASAPSSTNAPTVAGRIPATAPRHPAWQAPTTPAAGSARSTQAQSAAMAPSRSPGEAVTTPSHVGDRVIGGPLATVTWVPWTWCIRAQLAPGMPTAEDARA